MPGLHTKTAAQLLEKRNDFLKDLAYLGTDVTVVEPGVGQGTFDDLSDTYSEATEVPTLYRRYILLDPLKLSDSDGASGHTAVVFGHKVSNYQPESSLICRVRPELPLAPGVKYIIEESIYKLDAVLNVARVGKLPLWNLVKFVKD